MILIILIVYFMLNCKLSCNGLKENFSSYPSLAGCEECLDNPQWMTVQQYCNAGSDQAKADILANFW